MKRSRTSKAIVVLLAAIVVLLIRGTRQQRQIRRMLVGFLALSWIGDQVDNVANFIGGVGDSIRNFVRAVVQQVVDWAQGLFDWIGDRLHDIESLAWAVYDAAITFAEGVYDRATAFASWVAAAARQYATDLVSWAVGIAQGLFDQVMTFAQAVLRVAIQFAQDLVGWAMAVAQTLFNGAIAFAQAIFDRLTALIGWVYDTVTGLLHAAVDAVLAVVHALIDAVLAVVRSMVDAAVTLLRATIDAAVALLREGVDAAIAAVRDELSSLIADVSHYVFGTVQAIIDVITTVLDWLIAIAAFPFDLARDLWAAFRTTGGQRIMQHMPDATARWSTTILDHATGYVASTDRPYQLPPKPDPRSGGGDTGSSGGVVSPGGGTPDRQRFAHALLATLGAPATDSCMSFLLGWMARENTTATFNPLATTLDYGSNTRFNSVGVRNYADFETGVAATARTLTGGGYDRIVVDLQRGDGHAAGQEHGELSRWSGGGYDTIAA